MQPDNNHREDFDVLIAGAGPAGLTLALALSGRGLRIALLDKEDEPGKKICGDALSGKVMNILRRLPGNAFNDFLLLEEKMPAHGIRFQSPGGKIVDVPFPMTAGSSEPAGYTVRRDIFDRFLYEKAASCPDITFFFGYPVQSLSIDPGGVTISSGSTLLTGKFIAGADGVNSAVRRLVQPGIKAEKKHFCSGIRAYFTGVTGAPPGNFIELLFLKELLPGYFWIFPEAGGRFNAGLGILQRSAEESQESLLALFQRLIRDHPLLSGRFRDSVMQGKAGAHRLPLATFKMKRSGDRYMLLGDAAFLVDPFSGEGIGNAMASAEVAARNILRCFEAGDFPAAYTARYDEEIENRLGGEFRISAAMQRLAVHPGLLDFVIGKAARNKSLRELFSAMYTSQDIRKKLLSPVFYAGMLFR